MNDDIVQNTTTRQHLELRINKHGFTLRQLNSSVPHSTKDTSFISSYGILEKFNTILIITQYSRIFTDKWIPFKERIKEIKEKGQTNKN